jgi:hypothetical protein
VPGAVLSLDERGLFDDLSDFFAWTTSEAWLPATSVVCAFILAANDFWASGARTLSFVLMT